MKAKNKKQKRKGANKRLYIARGGVLTVQEGLDLSQIANTETESRVANQEAIIQKRVPSKCSMYKSQLHTAHICLTNQSFNYNSFLGFN